MAAQLAGISKRMLVWARSTSGLSLSDVAAEFERSAEDIQAWEDGQTAPTYAQLETLAYKLYKRPLAAFFLPEPPEEVPLKKEFRALPQAELARLAPDTLRAIREMHAKQLYLHDLTDGTNPSRKPIFHQLRITADTGVTALAEQVRAFLGLTVEAQLKWANSEKALDSWRIAVEQAGVFVFKRSFEQKDISGFCLLDSTFPVICLNNSSSANRQIFTLFHELCHILFHTNGICKVDDTYIKSLRGTHRRIETMCNRFSAALVLPESHFVRHVPDGPIDESAIGRLAKLYKVSRSVVLRRLYELKRVSKNEYEDKEGKYVADYIRQRGAKGGGGNYYLTQVAYLGRTYIALVMNAYRRKKLNRQQLAEFLGVRAHSLEGLEQASFARPAAA